jgi:1,4-alpha-glucan branching enzyme
MDVSTITPSGSQIPAGRSREHMVQRPLQRVVFRFDGRRAPAARTVALVGSFNHWNPGAHPLRRDRDGWWSVAVWLPAGEYDYLFLVDGAPWNDPLDDGRAPSEWGGHYSRRVVA